MWSKTPKESKEIIKKLNPKRFAFYRQNKNQRQMIKLKKILLIYKIIICQWYEDHIFIHQSDTPKKLL